MMKVLKGFLAGLALAGVLATPSFSQDFQGRTFPVIIQYSRNSMHPGYIVENTDHSASLYDENYNLVDALRFVETGTYSDTSPKTYTRFASEKFAAIVHNDVGNGSAVFRGQPHPFPSKSSQADPSSN